MTVPAWPRLLKRQDAASYLSLSVAEFERQVAAWVIPEARVHRMPPGPDRWKERSRTCPGIAAAMAAQWGEYITNPATDLFGEVS